MASNFMEALSTGALLFNSFKHVVDGIGDVGKVIKDHKETKADGIGDNSLFRRLGGFMLSLYPGPVSPANYNELMTSINTAEIKIGLTGPDQGTIKKRLNLFLDKYYSEIEKVPELKSIQKTFGTVDKKVIKNDILLAGLCHQLLSPTKEVERTAQLKTIFVMGMDSKTDDQIADELYTTFGYSVKTIINRLSINPIQIWSKFEDDLYDLVVNDDKCAHALSRWSNKTGLKNDPNDLVHDFLLQFIQQLSRDIQIENDVDSDDKPMVIKKNSPVVLFMDDWFKSVNNKTRLLKAVAYLPQPESVATYINKKWNKKIKAEKRVSHRVNLMFRNF